MDIKLFDDSNRIFDFHTHIFPEIIANKAVAGISDFYKIPMDCKGTACDLMKYHKESGVCGCMICSAATVPSQVSAVNDFIADSVANSNGYFVGFCTLHPDMSQSELDDEINRAVLLGLCGIKLHPDFQKFEADCNRAYAVYEVIGDRLPILIHSGDSRFSYSSPIRIANALDRFPNLTMIAAHLGGWSEWNEASLVLAGRENLYVDTSSSLYALTPKKAREYIAIFGEERVLFGTDYPMWNIKEELERFNRLDLSDDERDKILYGNVKNLLGL